VPERVRVTDEQACALPESPPGWHEVAISCFEHPDHGAVPILDLPRLFSGPLPMAAASTPQAESDYEPGYRRERLAGDSAFTDGADQQIGTSRERAALAAGGP
jgi:hypothetical protein